MKRSDLFFAALQVPLDYLALVLAGWLAYTIRFEQVNELLPVVAPLDYGDYFRTVALVAVGWVIVLAMAGVYTIRLPRVTHELARIFLGASTAVLLIIVLIFFQREFFTSRFIILAGWILAILALWVTHLLMRLVRRLLYRRGIGIQQVVVVGNDQTTVEVLKRMHTQPALGLRVARHFSVVDPESVRELEEMLKANSVDLVIQADARLPRTQTLELIDRSADYGVRFSYAADQFDTHASRVEMDYVAGLPVMELKRTPLDGWGRILKRAVDIVGAAIGLIVVAIPGFIVALIIKLDSAGPVFVQLHRVGQGQRRFTLWKFRSMIRDAHALKTQLMERNERADGPLFKITDDPRITRMGRWLRKTSIDELPQLWNVLRGEMSLVGPRPHEPEEVAKYEKHHKKLLTIKPGLTGMAQISGRSQLSFEDEARLDTYYIEHWSLSLDVTILLRTPTAVLNMKSSA